MKKLIFIIAFLVPFFSSAQNSKDFETLHLIKTTPLNDQQNTGTCWSFASTSFLETEALRLGKDSVRLSPMFYVPFAYLGKAQMYLQTGKKTYFGAGDLPFSVFDVYKTYGAAPEEIYDGKVGNQTTHNHRKMDKLLVEKVKSLSNPQDAFEGLYPIVEAHIGIPPTEFTYQGKKYTSKSFAKEFVGINPDDYIEITSYTHAPFYKPFVLKVPANWSQKEYINLPLQDFKNTIDEALKNGFSLAWDGDASESSFKFRKGLLELTKEDENKTITQEDRQTTYKNGTTTDDHNMHLIGKAKHKKTGKIYYILKNSEGNNAMGGYIYMSENTLLLKTISLTVHKEALPQKIKAKTAFLFDNTTKVSFIEKTPTIDGELDEGLEFLPKNKFNYIWQFDNPVTDTVPITYQMAYTPTHFYLYVETGADSITYRSRGFLNGDGLKFLLAKAQENQENTETNEYYDMVFSASKDKDYWARKRIINYNWQQRHSKKLTESTKFEELAIPNKNKSGFEILIAWEDIKPYHPWLMDKMGYNIYFAKAIGYTITNGYAVVEDEGIWDEELPTRNYRPLSFEKPKDLDKAVSIFALREKNITVQSDLNIEYVSNRESKNNVSWVIEDVNKKAVLGGDFTIKNTDFRKEVLNLPTQKLGKGKYNLIVLSEQKDTLLQTEFIILPEVNFKKIINTLRQNENNLSEGITNTLLFKLQELKVKLSQLKSYENGEVTFSLYEKFETEYNSFLEGKDPFENITKPYRRAFLSKYDKTYQPYTIKLPENYNPNTKYPLLVFLHGSGQDEQGVLHQARSAGDFIEIAPLARDIFRAYSSDESQKDILEAIEDAQKHFSVDKNNIVIGGFSMGGYGALRTFYENPDLYKGVAVFAGHPNLANYWLGGDFPNFSEQEFLKDFKNKPVFIYHGKKDGALPVQLIEEMTQELQKAGAKTTIRIVADKGHEYPDEETNTLYFDWLKKIVE